MKSYVSVRSEKASLMPNYGIPTDVSVGGEASALGAAANMSVCSAHWMNCVETKSVAVTHLSLKT